MAPTLLILLFPTLAGCLLADTDEGASCKYQSNHWGEYKLMRVWRCGAAATAARDQDVNRASVTRTIDACKECLCLRWTNYTRSSKQLKTS